jgi:hypothetical protein
MRTWLSFILSIPLILPKGHQLFIEAWNILLLMLLVEEVRKNRMNHEYVVITSLWTLILLFVKFIPTIE